MTHSLSGLERVSEAARPRIQRYATLVKDLGGNNARSLTLFGHNVAGGDVDAGVLLRSVLVLGEVDLTWLRRLADRGIALGKERIAAPLIMTPAYIDQSRDTFPLELLEIQQQHLTIFGEDYFEPLGFDPSHVRLQCERELKICMIQMRQRLLQTAGREGLMTAVILDVVDSVLRALRGLLWLKNDRRGRKPPETIDTVEQVLSAKFSGLRHALQKETPHDPESFDHLYRDVEALKKIMDGWS